MIIQLKEIIKVTVEIKDEFPTSIVELQCGFVGFLKQNDRPSLFYIGSDGALHTIYKSGFKIIKIDRGIYAPKRDLE